MTVQELIDRLEQMDPNLDVLVSKDAEGNGFSVLDCVEHMLYHTEDQDIMDEGDVLEADLLENVVEHVVVLWP